MFDEQLFGVNNHTKFAALTNWAIRVFSLKFDRLCVQQSRSCSPEGRPFVHVVAVSPWVMESWGYQRSRDASSFSLSIVPTVPAAPKPVNHRALRKFAQATAKFLKLGFSRSNRENARLLYHAKDVTQGVSVSFFK